MFVKMISDLKQSTRVALRLSAFAIVIAIALFIATSFLCAALFVFVLDRYGLIEACLADAGAFLVVALVAARSYVAIRRKADKQRAAAAKAASASLLSDPAMLTIGLQLAQVIGIRKLVPILALGGLALGFMSHRSQAPEGDIDSEA